MKIIDKDDSQMMNHTDDSKSLQAKKNYGTTCLTDAILLNLHCDNSGS